MASLRFSVLVLLLSISALFPQTSQNFFSKGLQELKDLFMPKIASNPDDVKFYLYPNPNDLTDTDELFYKDHNSLRKSRLKPSLPFVFLIHGFTQNYTDSFPQNVKNAYLQNGYGPLLNIIAVDWSKLNFALDPNSPMQIIFFMPAYAKTASNVVVVGKRVAQFIQDLMKKGYLHGGGDRVHVIGFSLGAHVAGNVGKYFGDFTKTLLYRITGLEPAGPSFQDDKARSYRLSNKDAQFVDVVHTNEGEFGFKGALGDVDFFVNGGGPIQPHCDKLLKVNQTAVEQVKVVGECSHNSAPVFYALSIRNKTMKGCPGHDITEGESVLHCDRSKQVVFGENCPPNAKGEYFVEIILDKDLWMIDAHLAAKGQVAH